MQLARDGILQFPSGPTTASLTIYNDSGGGLINCAWTKNGVTQPSIPNGGNISTTLNAGDTFTVYANGGIGLGATIDYTLNGTFVTSYFGDPIATTPTITAVGGNTYVFSCYEGV